MEKYNYGSIIVKNWSDDRKSAFSMTFDDGYQAHYLHVSRIFNQFGFKGTFYVNPHTIKEKKEDSNDEKYAYWFQLSEMVEQGHEIGSHSFSHPYLNVLKVGDEGKKRSLLYELFESKKKIEEMIPNYQCITLAYPYGPHNSIVDKYTMKYYEAARSAGANSNNASLNEQELISLNSKLIKWRSTREKPEDDDPKLKRFIKWIERETILPGKWGILVAHEVLPFSEIKLTDSYEPTSNEWLIKLCNWLKIESENKNIWIDTVANISKYIKQRDNFSYSIISQSDEKIEIKPETNLNNEIFNYPLTVDIIVPEEWDSIILSQKDRKEIIKSQIHSQYTFITTKVIPDGSIIELMKS